MKRMIRAFLVDKCGATAIEYALICALVFMAIVAAVTLFADRSAIMYNKIAAQLK